MQNTYESKCVRGSNAKKMFHKTKNKIKTTPIDIFLIPFEIRNYVSWLVDSQLYASKKFLSQKLR